MTGVPAPRSVRPAAVRAFEAAVALGFAVAVHLGAVALILPRLTGGGGASAPEIALAAAPAAWVRLAEAWQQSPPVAAAPEPPHLAAPRAETAAAPPAQPAPPAAAPHLAPPLAQPAAMTEAPPPMPEAPPALGGPIPTAAAPPAAALAADPGAAPAPPAKAQPVALPPPPRPAAQVGATADAPPPRPEALAQPATPPQPQAAPSRPAAAGARGPATEAWQAETRGRIEAALRLPRGARALAAGGGGARVGIAFEVSADGRLLSVAVVAPSGQPALDAAAVAAVRAASPFAPPPAGRTTTAQLTINLRR